VVPYTLSNNDYRSDRWFEVALSGGAVAGGPVVAIGNPAIGELGKERLELREVVRHAMLGQLAVGVRTAICDMRL